STTLSAVTAYLGGLLPGADVLWQILNFLVAFAITTGLFAAIYKLLPDAEIAWSDVWIGAVVTALLFSIGRFLLGLYLSNGSTTSVYGAAGSFAVLLLWVYYSAQILFFGAEFTQVYANRYGSHIVPTTAADTPASAAPESEQAVAATAPAPEEAKPRKQAGLLGGFLAGLLMGRRRRAKYGVEKAREQ
nr:YihY/virulence factor BrkB family protein [Chloroflexaceae bacterium]